eukprot:5929524-Pleurochrysis_carterae.AAC.1
MILPHKDIIWKGTSGARIVRTSFSCAAKVASRILCEDTVRASAAAVSLQLFGFAAQASDGSETSRWYEQRAIPLTIDEIKLRIKEPE